MRACQKWVLATCSVVWLAGCAGAGGGTGGQEVSAFPDAEVQLAQLDEQFVRRGRLIEPGGIAQVTNGISQGEVQELLGQPVASYEGDAQQWWFYNINLPLSEDMNDYWVCQYRVTFDDQARVSGAEWRRSQCKTRYNEFLQSQGVVLSGDMLFPFDSAELTPAGQHKMHSMVELISNDFDQPEILVVGHADRIGSDTYNDELSQRRADAVGDYFISRGVPGEWISTIGRGESQPLVSCDGTQATKAVKHCLQPNRRVHITIEE